jgi:hypothetical protein
MKTRACSSCSETARAGTLGRRCCPITSATSANIPGKSKRSAFGTTASAIKSRVVARSAPETKRTLPTKRRPGYAATLNETSAPSFTLATCASGTAICRRSGSADTIVTTRESWRKNCPTST